MGIEMVLPFLTPILSGLGTGMVSYFKKAQNGEDFSAGKLFRTGIASLVVAIGAQVTHQQVTADNWETMVAAYAGIITITEHGVVGLLRATGVNVDALGI